MNIWLVGCRINRLVTENGWARGQWHNRTGCVCVSVLNIEDGRFHRVCVSAWISPYSIYPHKRVGEILQLWGWWGENIFFWATKWVNIALLMKREREHVTHKKQKWDDLARHRLAISPSPTSLQVSKVTVLVQIERYGSKCLVHRMHTNRIVIHISRNFPFLPFTNQPKKKVWSESHRQNQGQPASESTRMRPFNSRIWP